MALWAPSAYCTFILLGLSLMTSMQKLSLKKNKSQGRAQEKEDTGRSTLELPPSLPEALQVASQVELKALIFSWPVTKA